MVGSFVVSLVLLVFKSQGISWSTHVALLITVAVTTICWVAAAFLCPETDKETLLAFYRKVRPFGPGWRRVRLEAGITDQEAQINHENIPLALLGWVAGCALIWAGLFTIGNFLYGRLAAALILLGIFVVAGCVLVAVINRLWSATEPKAAAEMTAASGEQNVLRP
jgi:hypothetical protein